MIVCAPNALHVIQMSATDGRDIPQSKNSFLLCSLRGRQTLPTSVDTNACVSPMRRTTPGASLGREYDKLEGIGIARQVRPPSSVVKTGRGSGPSSDATTPSRSFVNATAERNVKPFGRSSLREPVGVTSRAVFLSTVFASTT